MVKLIFDKDAVPNDEVRQLAERFLSDTHTLGVNLEAPTVIFQDGKGKGYFIKCDILAADVSPLLDMNARLNPTDADSFRANRELQTENNTFKRMVGDAKEGREFNDIIVEYTTEYSPTAPLKIWGGQHRARAIQDALKESGISRYHGFRIFLNLSKKQRTDLALISNTNIAVSNDLFDRLQEETIVGLKLRDWCYRVGFLKSPEDFPDQGSRLERMTVKLARTFIVNFVLGREQAAKIDPGKLDTQIYEPYLCESGVELDNKYSQIVSRNGDVIWSDPELIKAGIAFSALNRAQQEAVKNGQGIKNLKGFRNKAMTESVISAWAFVAGLLQADSPRLSNHFSVPPVAKGISDPLNAQDMSTFQHDSDDATYRGLGTRSIVKDRQRMAQLFLARSVKKDTPIDKQLMSKAVSTVVGLKTMSKGYTA